MNIERFNELQLGQMVYIITGPGDWADDGMCSMQGPIIEKSETQWGHMVKVKIEKCRTPGRVGATEMIMNVYKVGERRGIGSYVK